MRTTRTSRVLRTTTATMRWSLLILMVGWCGPVWGQSTINFNCRIDGFERVGGSLTPVTGTGTLSLLGIQLHYNILIPAIVNLPAEAHFHVDGTPLRTSLSSFVFTPGLGGGPGSIRYAGVMPVSEAVPELLQGTWYVQIHSPEYLNGVMRGYVVPVPEPGAGVLVALAATMFGFRKLTRRSSLTGSRETERTHETCKCSDGEPRKMRKRPPAPTGAESPRDPVIRDSHRARITSNTQGARP